MIFPSKKLPSIFLHQLIYLGKKNFLDFKRTTQIIYSKVNSMAGQPSKPGKPKKIKLVSWSVGKDVWLRILILLQKLFRLKYQFLNNKIEVLSQDKLLVVGYK